MNYKKEIAFLLRKDKYATAFSLFLDMVKVSNESSWTNDEYYWWNVDDK